MLQIVIPKNNLEFWDDSKQEFLVFDEQTLLLEHSLVSVSKWESKWHKAFLKKREKSREEIIDYIRCMTLNEVQDPRIYWCLTQENVDTISEYINNSMSAIYIPKENTEGTVNSEVITSELIYYWMTIFNIPFECENWHLNRLLSLIRVCNIKSQPAKKRSKDQILRDNAALNRQRRAKLNSKG